MRKFMQLCGILILACVLFAISAIGIPHLMPEHVPPQTPPPQTPPPEISQTEGPYHAIIEYGNPEVIKHNSDPLFAYIRFPQAGYPTDQDIYDWAHSMYNNITAEFQAVQVAEPTAIGEVNVHFDSFLVDNRYAGIFQNGEFSYSLAMPPEVIVKTFNIDLTRNEFLESTDILDYSQSDLILDLLHDRLLAEHPDTGAFLSYINEAWLNQLIIGHEGIIVVLQRYAFLPETFDTLTVTLPYDDLGSALLIRTEPPLDAPPTPVPTEDPHQDDPPYYGDDDDEPHTGDGDDDDDDDDDDDEPHQDEQPAQPPPVQDVPPQSGNIDPSRPMIALSFDDGPGVFTNDFLDLFEQYGVRATFCTIGNLVKSQSNALARAVSMNSEVIGHSWDHKNLAKLSAEDVKKQLLDTSDIITSVTGTTVHKFRPPYGEVSETMKEVAAELGFVMINWNVDPEDWRTKDADAVYNAVMTHAKDGAIILSHEIYRSTLEAYKRIIPELLSQGYQLVTVSELLYHKVGDLTPGHIYYNG